MKICSLLTKVSRRTKPVLVAGALVVAFTTVAAGAEPVAASQFAATSGSVGTVVPPTIYIGDVYQSGSKYFSVFGSTGPTVYRSPAAAGTQYVRVRYVVERWNGAAWVALATSNLFSAQIAANQSGVRFTQAPNLLPTVTTGYFRLTYAVGWLDASGASLAIASIIPTTTGDQFCTTVNPNRSCFTYAGYVQVG
ncbi:MAG: hypothetical protein ABIR32_00700 [Ilumatobacteraceae bacterium]